MKYGVKEKVRPIDYHARKALIEETQAAGRALLDKGHNAEFVCGEISERNTYRLCQELIEWANIVYKLGANPKFTCFKVEYKEGGGLRGRRNW